MHTKFTSFFSLIIVFGISAYSGFSQTTLVGDKIRIYNYPMNPRQHPDDGRRFVKPPDADTFGNQIQFMALRSLEGDYKKSLDTYTIKYGLGNIIWPAYPFIYRTDLPEIVQELKKRDLYLFDIWGYVPGSGPGGYWQQFVVPQSTFNLFEKELGNRWLGMDNGEQDGRYVGGFATIHTRCYLNGLRVRGNPTAITLPPVCMDTALLYPVSLSAMSTVGHSIGIPIDSYVPRPNNPLIDPGGGFK